jgi:hypothetical protein
VVLGIHDRAKGVRCSEGISQLAEIIASHQLRRGRTAQEGAKGVGRIERCMRGSRELSGPELAWDAGDGWGGGGEGGIYGR